MKTTRTQHAHAFRTKDLFELASMDALGILDEQERKAFEAAFAAAPEPIRAQLRAQQGLMGSIADTLPRVDAPSSLRSRVLAAVQGAITATRLHEAGREAPAIIPSRYVNRFWRSAAIGFAAAAVVFGFATVQMQWQYRELDQAFMTNAAADMFIKDFGPRFEQLLLAPNTQVVKFASTSRQASAGLQGKAVLLLDPASRTGQFLAKDLPLNSGRYTLVVVGADGQTGKAILNFTPSGSRIAQPVTNISIPDGATLAVQAVGPEKSETVLRSQSL